MSTEVRNQAGSDALKILLRQVEKAESPDRELDLLIKWDLDPAFFQFERNWLGIDGPSTAQPAFNRWSAKRKKEGALRTWKSEAGAGWPSIPPYTGSVDASIALAKSLLPGWGFHFREDSEGAHGENRYASFLYPKYNLVTAGCKTGKTLPLAILAAMLTALIAEANSDPERIGKPTRPLTKNEQSKQPS